MPRPRNPEPVVTMSIRLPESLIRAVDENQRALSEANPGLTISRADVIRNLIEEMLRIRRNPLIEALLRPLPKGARRTRTQAELEGYVDDDRLAPELEKRVETRLRRR